MSNHPAFDASHAAERGERTYGTVDQQRDDRWIARCLAGEVWAFERLLESHETMVRSMIRRLVDAEHEVDELAQQTFVAAYENLRQYAGTARFSTWLCQIALNKSRDHMRRRRRARQEETDVDELDLASDARGPDGLLAAKQLDRQLQAALRAMRRADREVIVFKYIAGHSYETVAQILGCTPQAAKVRSMRARDELKKVLEGMGIEP